MQETEEGRKSVSYTHLDVYKRQTKYTLEYDKLPVMDKWLLSKLNTVVKAVDENLANYKIPETAREMCIRDSFYTEQIYLQL